MFSLPQVISMALRRAAGTGNFPACWLHAVFLRVVHTNQPVHFYHSVCSISFHQPQPTNTTRFIPPRPALNTRKQNSSVFRLIAGSLDMLCPNFVSLMCTHASTQEVRALLDKGVGPDEQQNVVRICAVKGSVRLVCIAALFALVSSCIVCRTGARCAGSGVTLPAPMHS